MVTCCVCKISMFHSMNGEEDRKLHIRNFRHERKQRQHSSTRMRYLKHTYFATTIGEICMHACFAIPGCKITLNAATCPSTYDPLHLHTPARNLPVKLAKTTACLCRKLQWRNHWLFRQWQWQKATCCTQGHIASGSGDLHG